MSNNDNIPGTNANPKATVNAQTDMTETGRFTLPDDFDFNAYAPQAEAPDHEIGPVDFAKQTVAKGLRALEGTTELPGQAFDALNRKAEADDGVLSNVAQVVRKHPYFLMGEKANDVMSPALDGAAKIVEGSVSEEGQAALKDDFVKQGADGSWKLSDDPAVWAMNLANVIGYAIPTVATAAATGGGSTVQLLPSITNLAIRTGASPQFAAKVAPMVVKALANAPAATVGVSSDLGSQGIESKQTVLEQPFSELVKTQAFQDEFRTIDTNPEHTGLTDTEKLTMARENVSNMASRSMMTDPKVLATSVAATLIGDVPLANTLLKGASTKVGLRSLAGGFASGVVREAPMEILQEGTQQYAQNEVSNEFAGTDVDPWDGVAESAIAGGVLGSTMGGGMGTVGGVRTAQNVDPAAVDVSATVNAGEEMGAEHTNPTQETPIPQSEPVDVSATAGLGDQPSSNPPADLDVPTYLRQHNRGYEDVVGDVGQDIPKTTSPSAVDLIQSQMASGDQGNTLQERVHHGELATVPFAAQKPAESQSNDAGPVTAVEKAVTDQSEGNVIGESPLSVPAQEQSMELEEDLSAVESQPAADLPLSPEQQAEPRIQYNTNGQPFSTEKSAIASMWYREPLKEGKQVDVVPVDGGYAVRVTASPTREITEFTAQAPSNEGVFVFEDKESDLDTGRVEDSTTDEQSDAGYPDSNAQELVANDDFGAVRADQPEDKAVMFSHTGNSGAKLTGKGMPKKQADVAVQSWLREYKGGARAAVKVVQTQAEAEAMLGIKDDGTIHAFYLNNEVVVVADNIQSSKELRSKLRHEVLVHHGLAAVVGDVEYDNILMKVYSGKNSKYLRDTWDKIEISYSDKPIQTQVEEVLAAVAETERNQLGQWYDRLIAAIAKALRKVGLMSNGDVTQAEMRAIVETLAGRVKSANAWDPNDPNGGGNGESKLSRVKFSRTSDAYTQALNKARSAVKSQTSPEQKITDGGFAAPNETLISVAVRKMADKFKVLKDVQANIIAAGGKVDDANNAYLAEELFHGKAENDLRLMRDSFVKPLADKMASHGISQKELDHFLRARHAEERNKHIASINSDMPDGGSGIKTEDAKDTLETIKRSGKQKQYQELSQIVYAMLQKQRDVLKSSSLESESVIGAWESAYKYYVPLKGIAKDEPASPRTGKGFAIGGKESKRAMGRKSLSESPTSHAIIDLTEKLIRARKNEVGNVLLKLIQDNPSDDYWQIFTSDNPDTASQVVERKNPETGIKEEVVKEMPVPMAMMGDFYFPAKKDGKTYYIRLHDERLMKAMKNIGPDTSNVLIRTLATVNRFLSAVNTSYNPEFVVGNFARDIQTAVINLSAEQTRKDGKIKGEKIVKQVMKDVPTSMRAVYASLRGKKLEGKTAQWQQHYEEFMADGAKTGWFDMKDIDAQAKELERMTEMANGSVKGKLYQSFDAVTGAIENANMAIENAVRLSAYVNARKAGISRKKAASLAKNMTVNFNRRGEMGTTLNAMYMFANASIQGSANFARTMYGLNGDGKLKWQNLNNGQKIALGAMVGSFVLAAMNRAGAGEDDDGVNWYDKVPDYVKERNFVIMKSFLGGEQDGSYWKIPMPYGYNLFSVIGTSMEAVAAGSKTTANGAGDVVMAAFGSFSPIGMQESDTASGFILKNALPTILKPFAEVGLNENFMGGQIYKENSPFGIPRPDSSLGRRGTPEQYKAFAQWLNEKTGGSAYRSGSVDINPDVMKYVVGYLGGGALRFGTDKAPGLGSALMGNDVEDRNIAFWSRISGKVMPYEDQSKFYDRRTDLLQLRDELKASFGADRNELYQSHQSELGLLPLLKGTEKQLKALRKRRDAIYQSNTTTAEKDLRIKNVERQMKKVIDRFNQRYDQR